MLDHVFLSVSDIERSIAFYAQALAPLGIADRVDYDGKDGPPGHPDLKSFGCKGRIFFWLRLSRVGRLDQRMLARTNVRCRRKETWGSWLGRGF